MSNLTEKHCLPCEGGTTLLNKQIAQAMLNDLPNWQLNESATKLQRKFSFKNFYETISFVNAIAWIANQENHHPNLEISYNYCIVNYFTHAIAGLSENDFICAAKINALFT